jgi:hypothetical protein
MESLKRQISLLVVSGSPLTGMQSSSSSSNRQKFNVSKDESSYNPIVHSSTNNGLLQRQKEVMKQQDDMILEIGIGVDRLHGQVNYVSFFLLTYFDFNYYYFFILLAAAAG